MTPSRLTDDLAMAASYANELRATVDQLRKFHPHEDEYQDLANGLEDLISDFIGSKRFADMRHEIDEAELSKGHGEAKADRQNYLAKVT